MIIGPYVDAASVLIGAIVGGLLAKRIPERLRLAMPLTFGAASMCMGIILIDKSQHMPVMVLSAILGSLIGELIYLEPGISMAGDKVRLLVERILPAPEGELSEKAFLEQFVAILVLFCASGTGIFGAMHEGMTGDSSVLVAKSFLDIFTAAIFATSLGFSVAAIAIPQVVILVALAYGATDILPLTTPAMQADFSAVGGLLMLVTGLRICGIKVFPVANMLPAIIIAMPISALWTHFF